MSQQTFSPSANTIARLSLLGTGLIGALLIGFLLIRMHSPYVKAPVGIAIEQPVLFSHELHSGQLNIDCQYCHTSVEESAYAGIPDTHTCMTCHSQIATYSELLQPVRDSYETGERLEWKRVHKLAEHVYFKHNIHVNKGVGCETCHGRIDQMPQVWQAKTMTMRWCLECHQNPGPNLRPLDQITTMGWEPPLDEIQIDTEARELLGMQVSADAGEVDAVMSMAMLPVSSNPMASGSMASVDTASDTELKLAVLGVQMIEENHVTVDGLMDCSVCHR